MSLDGVAAGCFVASAIILLGVFVTLALWGW